MRRERLEAASVLIALVASILTLTLPDILARRELERVRRTAADMRTIGTALEARAAERNAYFESRDPRIATAVDALDFANAHAVTVAELERELVPVFARVLPRKDAWGSDFDIRVGTFSDGCAQTYAIRSLGRDRTPDRQRYELHKSSLPEEDLVFYCGNFLPYPNSVR